MRNLVAIKMKVGLQEKSGYAKYPNFNLISSSIRKGLDWSKYVDTHGASMHYDKTSGHKEETADSPYGQQWVCTCVPADFANEAVRLFPNEVSILPEIEFATFYDDKAHANDSDEITDANTLNGLYAQRQLMIARSKNIDALDAKIDKALNPADSERGVNKNVAKKWADIKAKMGVNLT